MTNPLSLSDFPILTEESDLSGDLVLQKRMSGCGRKAALTIRIRETVVWLGVLELPWRELADCLPGVKAAMETHEFDLSAVDGHFLTVENAYAEIFARSLAEVQRLAETREATVSGDPATTIARAQEAVQQARSAMLRQRQSMESAETLLRGCERNIVLSRLKILLADGNADQASREKLIESTSQAFKAASEKRSLIREEERAIHEAEAAIAQSEAALTR